MDDREFNTIVEEALSLDTSHRGELADKLIASLPAEDRFMDEWLNEAERRKAQWDAGEIQGIDADEALRQLRAITS
jgi:hypothetical protein